MTGRHVFMLQPGVRGDDTVTIDQAVEWLRGFGAEVLDAEGNPWEMERDRSRRSMTDLVAEARRRGLITAALGEPYGDIDSGEAFK